MKRERDGEREEIEVKIQRKGKRYRETEGK